MNEGTTAARALDEYAAKRLLEGYGVPCVAEALADDAREAAAAAERLGYPVAVKGCGASLLHKTELGLVALGLASEAEVRRACERILVQMDGRGRLLVQRVAAGERELLIGMTRDPQFGPVVSFGLGGILTEALADVALRVAPFGEAEAAAMLAEIRAWRILGELRGLPAVNRATLVRSLLGVARLALERHDIREIDINPLVVCGGEPVAVDALVVLDDGLRA
jgi:acetyl-CoA synthetase (ADP-forming)